MDQMVLQVQQWLNTTYSNNTNYTLVPEDGITGGGTVAALITALQIELNISPADGVFGPATQAACPTLASGSTAKNEVYILQGALYCKGYNPNGLDGGYGNGVVTAIKKFQSDAGLTTQDGITTPMIFKTLLNTDAFVLISGGDSNIRTIQQNLNRDYNSIIGLIPSNGVYSKSTNVALIKALQHEEGNSADGIWGPATQAACPTIPGSKATTKFILLLQYSLYCNGYNPNGFDGLYGNGVKTAVTNFQTFVGLTADGYAGPQVWASLLVSYGDPNRKGTACDCSTTITSEKAATLKANGYKVVGRYLTGKFRMTSSELQTIFTNGLRVFPIFETAGTNTAYFTESQGIADANTAILSAGNLGFDAGTIIYFAVDYDAMDYEVTNSIIPYFQSIKEEFNRLSSNKYKIGIYGPRNICSRVAAAGYSYSSFVSDMSSGFSGNIGYKLPVGWAFDQISTISIGTGTGLIEIDNNICSNKDMGVDHVTIASGVDNWDALIDDSDIIKKINNSDYLYDQAEINFNNGVLTYDQKTTIQNSVRNEADIARADYIVSNPYSDYAYGVLGGSKESGNPLNRELYNTQSSSQLSGLDVILIQRVLELYGYFDIPDGQFYGIYGPATEDAVTSYQEDNGITVDGRVGTVAMATLFSESNQDQRTPYWLQLLNMWRGQHHLVRDHEAEKLHADTEVTIQKGSKNGINVGYADIVKIDTKQVWEVKPDKEKYYGPNGIGTKQLTRYINASMITNQFEGPLVAGDTVQEEFIYYSPDECIHIRGGVGPSPETGLILYEVRPNSDPGVVVSPAIETEPETSIAFQNNLSINWGVVAGVCLIGTAVLVAVAISGGTALIPLVLAL
ncbi:peptidoglycan-binding protein [Clostridium pasteurianum]|uniref:peptidoglycan-binding protein n=1 Tax=Clostridium pasteurianum TaxID=1501 RepID=UPI0008DB9D16|nr:glycoside hydrolase domain-containing protein [Clostridium pasteurianum]AOZ77882.1 hypothetical protein AQ984_02770 [Clostridium pasteurianum]